MSSEIKEEDEDVQSEHDENQDDEQSAEIIKKISLDDQEENEPALSTPNGRETPSAASFSDVIIEKQDEESEPEAITTANNTHQLLQIIAEKSNKDANSAILNTVSFERLLFGDHPCLSSCLTVISIWTRTTSSRERRISPSSSPSSIKCLRHFRPNFSAY